MIRSIPSLVFLLSLLVFSTDSLLAAEPDPAASYLFYLHGKIIEDQGLPAVSPEHGKYRYREILEDFESEGFVVRSEVRSAGADPFVHAKKVSRQIKRLLAAGVPAERINVVGASKGAFIASVLSHELAAAELSYVLLGACHPSTVDFLLERKIELHGRVLAIRDASDRVAGSCERVAARSPNLVVHQEIVLDLGLGHGLLYSPLDEWVKPAVAWAKGEGKVAPSP